MFKNLFGNKYINQAKKHLPQEGNHRHKFKPNEGLRRSRIEIKTLPGEITVKIAEGRIFTVQNDVVNQEYFPLSKEYQFANHSLIIKYRKVQTAKESKITNINHIKNQIKSVKLTKSLIPETHRTLFFLANYIENHILEENWVHLSKLIDLINESMIEKIDILIQNTSQVREVLNNLCKTSLDDSHPVGFNIPEDIVAVIRPRLDELYPDKNYTNEELVRVLLISEFDILVEKFFEINHEELYDLRNTLAYNIFYNDVQNVSSPLNYHIFLEAIKWQEYFANCEYPDKVFPPLVEPLHLFRLATYSTPPNTSLHLFCKSLQTYCLDHPNYNNFLKCYNLLSILFDTISVLMQKSISQAQLDSQNNSTSPVEFNPISWNDEDLLTTYARECDLNPRRAEGGQYPYLSSRVHVINKSTSPKDQSTNSSNTSNFKEITANNILIFEIKSLRNTLRLEMNSKVPDRDKIQKIRTDLNTKELEFLQKSPYHKLMLRLILEEFMEIFNDPSNDEFDVRNLASVNNHAKFMYYLPSSVLRQVFETVNSFVFTTNENLEL